MKLATLALLLLTSTTVGAAKPEVEVPIYGASKYPGVVQKLGTVTFEAIPGMTVLYCIDDQSGALACIVRTTDPEGKEVLIRVIVPEAPATIET